MQILYLHCIEKLTDRIKTIPLEEYDPSICWFSDSEQFVIAYYRQKFHVINALAPETPVIHENMELRNYRDRTPKVTLDDKILILLNKDW